jgi:CRP-like cAMP-binding protein/pSer/pThr/pTyr-binding forkhead associated (FHA) protein/Fe-S-cluster-containing dehydrogenase component
MVGRDESCDLRLDDPIASRRHVLIRREGQEWLAEDQGSRNGTRIGDQERPITTAILRAGDELRVGETSLRISFDYTVPDIEVEPLRFTILEPASLAAEIRCTRDSVTIGRHPSCDVVVDDPTVSRLHAVVAKTSAGYVINDQKATNALYVGDPPERVTAAVLYDGETIRLGSARLRVHMSAEVGRPPEPPRISDATMMIPAVGPRPQAEVIQAQLAKAPLFQAFDDEDWSLFLSAYDRDSELHVEHFASGELVCEAGHFDSYFRLVLKGSIDASDPHSGEVLLTHRKGDFFGLIEAKKSLARTTRHIAGEQSQVLCLPRHQIRYVERNAAARALLAERHKEESWRVMAAQLPLLEGVPVDAITDLMQSSEIDFYDKAGIVLVREGEAGESVSIVRDGFLRVVKNLDEGEERILGYLRTGDIFGETAIIDDSPRTASVVTAGKAEVVKIDKEAFRTLCDQHPELVERLAQLEQDRKQARPDPTLARQLEKWGQGFIQADALLLMDLELCVKCDLCVQACEELHGESRLIRRGMELETALGTHLAPAACRHCDDPLCMFSCPTGAIKRRPEGEIFIDYDLCTGVGACALACPYDNIHMIETHVFDEAQAKKQAAQPDHEFFRPYPDQGVKPRGLLQRLLAFGKVEDPQVAASRDDGERHVPASYPIKCDMCDGLPFMGCVHACPTGAAMRVDPVDMHGEGVVGSVVRNAAAGGIS